MADCSNTPTPESTANFDLDSRCFSEVMTSNADYTTAKASDGNVKKTFASALRDAGWEHVGEWSTNPLVTSSNQVIPYAGTNQLFRPLSIPYQVDSATNPNPNALLPDPATGYAGELRDVSKFATDEDITEAQNEILGGSIFKGINGDYVQDGENINSGTTHILISTLGKKYLVKLDPVESGQISSINYDGAVIGGANVKFKHMGYAESLKSEKGRDVQEELSLSEQKQTNYVNLLRSFTPIKNQFRVYDSSRNVDVMCIYGNGKYVQYYFSFVEGDYITQGSAYTGNWVVSTINESGVKADACDYTGTWVNSTESINGYTKEQGATLKATINNTVKGNKLFFRHQSRDDGGDFSYVVKFNGSKISDGVISTYEPESQKEVDELLDDSLMIGEYEITLTYITSDPSKRGWITSLSQNVFLSAQPIYDADPSSSEVITTPSNKDFAIEVAPSSHPSSFELIPTHSGVKTDFEASERKWIIDGKEYLNSDLYEGLVIECKNLKLVQHVYGRNTASGSTNLCEIYGIQEINEFGELVMNGYLKPLEEIVFGNGYTMMHVGYLEGSDSFSTGIGNSYPITAPASQTNIPLISESDICINTCYLGRTNGSLVQNVANAMKVSSPNKTWRRNETKLGIDEMSYLQLRTSSVAKFYSNIFLKPFTSSGIISWSGKYKMVNDDLVDIVGKSF